MAQNTPDQRRQFFRLRYPKNERPRAKIMGRDFLICEISEQGVRILFTNSHPVSRGVPIGGTITFSDGEEIEIEGSTLRLDGNELIAQLTKGPDLKRINKEQIRLRKKYPGLFGKSGNYSFVK